MQGRRIQGGDLCARIVKALFYKMVINFADARYAIRVQKEMKNKEKVRVQQPTGVQYVVVNIAIWRSLRMCSRDTGSCKGEPRFQKHKYGGVGHSLH